VYFDTNNTISGASTINVTGQSFNHTGLGANDTRYYWAQAYDTLDNTLGSLVGPVSATTKRADTDDIIAQAITTDKIYDLAVTTAKIADLDVTAAKIANATITSGKLIQGTFVGSGNFFTGTSTQSSDTFSQNFGASANGDAFVLVTAKIDTFGSSTTNSGLVAELRIDGTTVDDFSLSGVGSVVFAKNLLVGGKSNVSGSFDVELEYTGSNVTNDQYAARVTVWRFLN